MTGKAIKSIRPVRCAIYTRVSTEQGLDQDFNSLDAQSEASQAYIRSQSHEGWTPVRTKYADGGFTGGNTDRPALQKLLEDVQVSKIDVIVVYKVDRLTRSLADFAKLVELFDRHNVSFVSVTQQFNTTTSMGRLTLNVLLSFAQFEREVTSERIRDKIAASKRKGLWVGGMVPLGYDTRDRRITVNEAEAERVRNIFAGYLKLGSLDRLMADLRERGIVTKTRTLRNGRVVGGIPFGRGPLAHLLRNRFYIGEVLFKGEVLPGEQPPIMDRALFDAVQARLSEQANHHTTKQMRSGALLTGHIFDDRGNRMTPSHSRKSGVKYPYYICSALVQGRAAQAGSISRVPAREIEALVIRSVRERLKLPVERADDIALVRDHIVRVEVQPDRILIELAASDGGNARRKTTNQRIEVPWHKNPTTRRREILLPAGASRLHTRPMRAEARARLVTSIAQARRWLDELTTNPAISVELIARRERCSMRKVTMTISLAFLAPTLVKAAIAGALPRGIGMTRLCDLPAEWSHQYVSLGLPEP